MRVPDAHKQALDARLQAFELDGDPGHDAEVAGSVNSAACYHRKGSMQPRGHGQQRRENRNGEHYPASAVVFRNHQPGSPIRTYIWWTNAMLLAILEDCPTPIGRLRLLRRFDIARRRVIHEMQLDGTVLMTSAAASSEELLADKALEVSRAGPLNVALGGLGLGHTAARLLQSDVVESLLVIELLPQVLAWHREGLLPLAGVLERDERCELRQGDFFSLALSESGFDTSRPSRRFDMVLLDIDHSPGQLLEPANAAFYHLAGLRKLGRHLSPDGLFALWSSGPPQSRFANTLQQAFQHVRITTVSGDPDGYTTPDIPRTLYLAHHPLAPASWRQEGGAIAEP